MKHIIILCICVCISCASAPAITTTHNAAALKNLMIGSWETASSDQKNIFFDTRIAMAPLANGEWVYLQLETGDERKLYRQRVLQLIDVEGGVVQKTWNFAEPGQFSDIAKHSDRLNDLSLDDLKPSLQEGCDQFWQASDVDGDVQWTGYVDPATCRVFSERRQATIAIEGETRLQDNQLHQTERGFDIEGAQLFGTAPGQFIELYRVIPAVAD